MSKEIERLFKPGECYIIMPNQSVYIFKNRDPKDYESAARLSIEHIQDFDRLHTCNKNFPYVDIPIHIGYGFYKFSAAPVGYVACKNINDFSKHRKKIDAMLGSQEKQTP